MQTLKPVYYLTADGLRKLERRLVYLKEERRPQMAEQLQLILEDGGGYDESPEYADAKNEQAFLEGEINRLETILRHACVIPPETHTNIVTLGSQVTVCEGGSHQPEVYLLVDSAEANPCEGKISIASPLGQALLNARVGERVCVAAPDGEIMFVVMAVD